MIRSIQAHDYGYTLELTNGETVRSDEFEYASELVDYLYKRQIANEAARVS